MTKRRDLFDELTEGFDALSDQRAGKRTLRTHVVKSKPAPRISARELARVRHGLALPGHRAKANSIAKTGVRMRNLGIGG